MSLRRPARFTPSAVVRDVLLLGLGATLLFVPWLGARDLWNPNEPLYGAAVAEMARHGDWLVPTVNGEVFDEKPILYFWMARVAAGMLGGVDEFALRLPSAVAGVAAVLLVYLLVWPYAGRARGRVAAILLATTFIVFWSARQIQMDLLLCTTTLGAMLSVTRVVDHGARPLPGWALAGVWAGLGLLAKGPLGLICPALVALAYLAWTARLRVAAAPGPLLGLVVSAAVAAPWYAALWSSGHADVLREVLLRQNVSRFVAPWDHETPWWYFLKYFWIDMAPWSFLLPLAVALQPTDRRERALLRLAWLWLAAIVVFFSLSASKRSPYILPAAPALVILVSAVTSRWRGGGLDRLRLGGAQAIHAAFAVLLVAAAMLLHRRALSFVDGEPGLAAASALTVWMLLATGAAVAIGLLVPWRRRFGGHAALLGSLGVLYLGASASVLPAVDVVKSHRPFCQTIRDRVGADRPLRGFHEWKWRASYSYYTGRSIPALRTLGELRGYWASPEQVFLVVERGRLTRARQVIGHGPPLARRRIGSNEAYLFENRPGDTAPPESGFVREKPEPLF